MNRALTLLPSSSSSSSFLLGSTTSILCTTTRRACLRLSLTLRLYSPVPSFSRYYSSTTPSTPSSSSAPTTISTSTTENQTKEPATLPLPSLIRSIAEMRKSGTFSTVVIHSERVQGPQVYGTPFMPYILVLRGNGTPVFALKSDSEHVSHLSGYSDASLVVYPLTPKRYVPSQLGLWRINLTGEMNKIPVDLHEEMLEKFCEVHPTARDHSPYDFYSLNVKNVYYYARGMTDMISVADYENAEVDVVAANSKKILDRLTSINSQYALVLMCKDYGNFAASEVVPYWVDRFGFNAVAKNEENQWTDVRFPFPFEMRGVDDCIDSLQTSIDHIIDKNSKKPKPRMDTK